MGFSEKVVTLKLTGAVVIEGAIARAGTLVEMVEAEAKDLLRRGKAELHGVLGDELRTDGPTVAEYVAAGYRADNYPPQGYASRSTDEEIQAAIDAQEAEANAAAAQAAADAAAADSGKKSGGGGAEKVPQAKRKGE